MKVCTKCKIEKELSDFNKNKSKKDGYNNICRVCSNANSKKYYQENKEEHIKTVRLISDNNLKNNRRLLFEYYQDNPCIDCGEDNPVVLECDHRDDEEKFKNVSKLVSGGYSWKVIEKEINKCDVRCANCHRIRTAEQLGWYKGLI